MIHGVDSWSTIRVLTPEPIYNIKYLGKMYRWKFSSGRIAPELLQESQDEKNCAVRKWVDDLEDFLKCQWTSLMLIRMGAARALELQCCLYGT